MHHLHIGLYTYRYTFVPTAWLLVMLIAPDKAQTISFTIYTYFFYHAPLLLSCAMPDYISTHTIIFYEVLIDKKIHTNQISIKKPYTKKPFVSVHLPMP